jgi:PE family
MIFVTAQPEAMASAAGRLESIGSALAAQHGATAAAMSELSPAAADEVSISTAAKFAMHAHTFQAFSAQADAMHRLFVATLNTSAGSYAATEAANTVATR